LLNFKVFLIGDSWIRKLRLLSWGSRQKHPEAFDCHTFIFLLFSILDKQCVFRLVGWFPKPKAF